MKENDWIVATINNPTFTAADFKNVQGLSLDNTQLLSKDDYLKSSFITSNPLFQNAEGNFDKSKFDTFYNNQAKKFSDFEQESGLDNYQYGFWDTSAKPGSKVETPKVGVENVLNPEHTSLGVVGQGVEGERQYSDMELAQMQKIVDSSTGKQLEYSANEASLFSNPVRFIKDIINPFKDALTLATYDEDGEHVNPITGVLETHKKGDKKLNAAGEYYLETLNGRSTIGKQIMSIGDTITSDTSSLNKYDFFDSDGLDKNPVGVITKNLVSVAPMALLGPVGTSVYGGLFVARELAKSLPMLYQISTSLFGNTKDSKLLNNVATIGDKFSSGTSEYAKEHTFSFENFGNLISDVALQWGQQKAIAEAISKIGNSSKNVMNSAFGKALGEYNQQANKILNQAKREEISQDIIQNLSKYTGISNEAGTIEEVIAKGLWQDTIIGKAALNKYIPEAQKAYANRLKLGQDLSLVYMAIISNTDVYESALEHGASKREAAMVALGSTMGMFAIDKYAHLGEMFFDDPDAVARREFKSVLRQEADSINSSLRSLTSQTTKEEKKNLLGKMQSGFRIAQSTLSKYKEKAADRSLNLFGKALGEGIEEVSEELVSDTVKSLYDLAAAFGYTATDSIGAWENAPERYAMSLFGGAIGGGLFGGIEALKHPKSASDKNTQRELMYLIKEGKTNDILQQLDEMHKKGQLGSRELSTDLESGAFISSNENKQSQNDFIYKTMKDSILQMESIINGNQLNISDDKLFERMILSDPKFYSLKNVLQGKSYITNYYNRFENLVQDVVQTDQAIKDLEDSTPDVNKRKTQEYINQMQELLDKKQQLKQEIDNFREGKYATEYVDRILFAMNPEISGQFTSMNFQQFVYNNYNKDPYNLTAEEETKFREEWENYNKTNRKLEFEEAYQLFKQMQQRINPVIDNISKNNDVQSWEKLIDEMEQNFPLQFMKNYYDITDDEVEGIENLEQQEIIAKKQELANQYNNENIARFIQQFVDNASMIDPSSYRRLSTLINKRRKDIVFDSVQQEFRLQSNGNSELINKTFKDFNEDSQVQAKIQEIIQKLNDDLSNLDEIKSEVKQVFSEKIRNKLIKNLPISLDQYFPLLKQPYYTFIDLLNSIQGQGEIEVDDLAEINGDLDLLDQSVAEDLVKVHNLLLNPSSETEQQKNEILLKYETPEHSFSEGDIQNVVLAGSNFIDGLLEEGLPIILNNVDTILETNIQNIKSNQLYKALTDLKKKVTFENIPTVSLIKSIASSLGDNFSDIETVLQSIYEQYERLDNIQDFLLNDSQLEALQKALQYIDIAEGFITAAGQQDSYFHIMPFYKTINEFVRNHRDSVENFEEYPELSRDIFNVSRRSLQEYRDEINQLIYNSGKNSLNKIKEFKEFDSKFSKVKLEFFKNNRNGFKLSDGTDFLQGFENIDLDREDAVFEIAKLLYENYWKSGKTAKDFVKIFKNIIPEYKNTNSKLVLQFTSKLDGSINQDNFTDYDKITYILSIVSKDPVDFYREYKSYIESRSVGRDGQTLAPLSFQEHVIKIASSQKNNLQFMNEALDAIAKDLILNVPILYNTTIVTGLGGSGKTDVVARYFSDDDNIWVSGPTSQQVDNLIKLNPNGRGLSKQELLNEILEPGEYAQIQSEVQSRKTGTKVTVAGYKSNQYVILKDSIKFKKLENPPKTLIIDEITLFSHSDILLLSKWAKLNNVHLIIIGDENQNGNQEVGYNISPNYMFAIRTPRLGISLRQGNYWKFLNQKSLERMLDSLRQTITDEEGRTLEKNYRENDFKNLQLHSYFKDGLLTGDLITPEITDEQIEALGDKLIGYVGDATDAVYQRLKDAGKNVELNSPSEIQGKEYDYVVINKDWTYLVDDKKTPQHILFSYLQDLYTMITRSRKGSIIIDNHLTDNIQGNKSEDNTTDAITLNPQSKEEFTRSKLEFLNQLDLNPRNIKTTNNVQPVTENPINEDEVVVVDPPVEIGPQFNQEERREEGQQENEPFITDTPFSIFGNIGFTGLNLQTINEKEVWSSNGSLRDLDILLSEDYQKYFPQAQRKNSLESAKDQREYSEQLIKLKSYIHFQNNYNSLPVNIKRLFTEEDLNNIEYYIVSEDRDLNKHHTLRIQQNLNDDENSFIKDSKGVSQVISLQARINKNGKVYKITLGTVQSIENMKQTRDILFNRLKSQNQNLSDAQINSEIDRIISQYDLELKNIVEQKERRINKPYFTKTTSLRKSKKYRLVDLDEKQSYNYATLGFVTSPIYTILSKDKLQALGLKPSLAGKPIMYVSANTNLNPSDLSEIYAKQRSQENPNLEVRVDVLDTEGVSFESLIRNNYINKYYKVNVSESKQFNLPFESLPTGVRMYLSLWNFRASIINFNDQVKKHFNSDSDLIDKLTQLDSRLYDDAKRDLNKDYLTEDEFRKWVQDNKKDEFQQLQPLWDFNDKATGQYRLGYSSKDGVYVRKVKDGSFAGFINRELAEQYEQSIRALFDNVIDADDSGENGLIPPIIKNNIRAFVDVKASQEEWKKLEEGWVKNIRSGGSLKVVTNSGVVDYKFGALDRIRMLPTIIKQIGNNIMIKGFEGAEFNPEDYPIKIGDKPLDYSSIYLNIYDEIQTIEEGDINITTPGVQHYVGDQGIIDKRIINMFNLAFHGLTTTPKFNDFTNARTISGSLFDKGFFVDTFIQDDYDSDRTNRKVLTNPMFYSTDVVPSGPMIRFSFDEYSEQNQGGQQDSGGNQQEQKYNLQDINRILDINISDGTSDEEVEQTIENELKNNINKMFDKHKSEDILNTIISFDGVNFITLEQVLRQKYPDFSDIKSSSSNQLKFTSNGKVVYITKDVQFGKYIIEESRPIASDNKDKQESANVTQIAEYIQQKLNIEDDNFVEIFVNNDEPSKKLSKKQLKNNKRIDNLKEEGFEDYIDDIMSLIDQLPENSNQGCVLPLS